MIAEAGTYERHLVVMAQRGRAQAHTGQNVSPLPEVVDQARRDSCAKSLLKFCETYFPLAFRLKWSPDHLRVIGKIEDAVLNGELSAFAMPRGSGKTTIAKAATIWAVGYGHRRWPVILAATGPHSVAILKGIKQELRFNEMLLADFPWMCHPVKMLQGSPGKARGQHHDDDPTLIEWGKDILVLPRVPGSLCPESRITCFGIEAAVRGQNATLSTGENLRPDLVLLDDPQTKATANSQSQTQTRIDILMGDVLGLAGPTTRIAGLMACTVIRKDDMADFVLDPKRAPEWRGERTKLVYKFPDDEKAWEHYFRLRENDLQAGGDGACATDYYRGNRPAMDAGSEVAWPERHPPEFESAIEHAMFLRHRDPHSFAAEYQNDPVLRNEHENQFPTAQQISGKMNGFEAGKVPQSVTTITGFIDVQQDVLFWMLCGWEPDFTGYVIDYGSFPQQNRVAYTTRNLRHTLAMRYPATGTEGAIFAGLRDLTTDLLEKQIPRDDGATLPVARLMVDSGAFTETIYGFWKNKADKSLHVSKGRGVTASNVPFTEFKARPGERVGENWVIAPVQNNRAVRLVQYDSNHWKTFVQMRFATAMGDTGCLSLYKATHYDHRMLAEHMTAEAPFRTEGRGRQLWEWQLPPHRPDNHFLDCAVGCAVGASIEGVALPDRGPKKTRTRRSLAAMAAESRRK